MKTKNLKVKAYLLVALVLWALYAIFPSIIYFATDKNIRNDQKLMEKRLPSWLPKKHVKLGLDLQGGVRLVLGVNTADAIDQKLSSVIPGIKKWAKEQSLVFKFVYHIPGKQQLVLELDAKTPTQKLLRKFEKAYPEFVKIEEVGKKWVFSYSNEQLKRIKDSAIRQVEMVVRSRIDKWGVSEPSINRRADRSILVQLPGFKNPEKAKELLGRTALLTFKIVDDKFTGFQVLRQEDLPKGVLLDKKGSVIQLVSEKRQVLLDYVKDKIPKDRQVFFEREFIAGGKKTRFRTWIVENSAIFDGTSIKNAIARQGEEGWPEVVLQFTRVGERQFAEVTGKNRGKRMAILLDDEVQSAPVIQNKIRGDARITLNTGDSIEKAKKEAEDLALILRSGALSATITVMEEREVGASLGPELANQGIKGVLIGFLLVFIFMAIYYQVMGVIAGVAIFLNGIFLLALMAWFEFALTLPGIAGFILTLGMAVDANVLINERIRQELLSIRNLKRAIDSSFDKVLWTIIDANITTLIAAIVLLETNPSGPIRGFAITLVLGIIVSMFTSLGCTRLVFQLMLSNTKNEAKLRRLFIGQKLVKFRKSFDFLRYSRVAIAAAVMLSLSALAMVGFKGLNWGVDFTGGSEMLLSFQKEPSVKSIRSAAKKAGADNITVQKVGADEYQYLLRFDYRAKKPQKEQDAKTKIFFQKSFLSELKSYQPSILQNNYVGPQVGIELRNQGILSVFYAIMGVLIYIWFRFDMRFAPGAVVKMILDVFILLGFYVFFDRSFDLTSVAAFLTVIGYSVNDTIVVYDRIRENLLKNPRMKLADLVNFSLNETLGRTINTSFTTLVALVGVLIFGSGQIWDFAMAMTLGVIVATFSSNFIASFFILWTESWVTTKSSSAALSR